MSQQTTAAATAASSRNVEQAKSLMDEFAQDTGLSSASKPQRRYLWTDGFAVANFFELARLATSSDEAARYRQLAFSLVDAVHNTLGRFRADDPVVSRRGQWLSGNADSPTARGLRIGKKLPERSSTEAFSRGDDDDEWDRDGQYMHYNTKWLGALLHSHTQQQQQQQSTTGAASSSTSATPPPSSSPFLRWAFELAQGAHAGFITGAVGSARRVYWKMRTDLSAPMVPTQGHHDPLDMFLTYTQIRAVANDWTLLTNEVADAARIMSGTDYATADALGLGGVFCDCWRTVELIHALDASSTVSDQQRRAELKRLSTLLVDLCDAGARSMKRLSARSGFNMPPAMRLAFRELGLSLGFQAIVYVDATLRGQRDAPLQRSPTLTELYNNNKDLMSHVQLMLSSLPMRDAIHNTWLDPKARRSDAWRDHVDINTAMLATSLIPDGFLLLLSCGNSSQQEKKAK